MGPTTTASPQAWRSLAGCVDADPEDFFPERGQSTAAALRVCAACPVRSDCLSWALDNRVRFGVWGGTTEYERRALERAATTRTIPTTTKGGDPA